MQYCLVSAMGASLVLTALAGCNGDITGWKGTSDGPGRFYDEHLMVSLSLAIRSANESVGNLTITNMQPHNTVWTIGARLRLEEQTILIRGVNPVPFAKPSVGPGETKNFTMIVPRAVPLERYTWYGVGLSTEGPDGPPTGIVLFTCRS